MRILYVTTIGMTMIFFKSLIKELVEQGHTVDIATNDSENEVDPFYKDLGCEVISISCVRSPLKKANLDAVKEIKRLVEERHYDIVHCHTPIAAMCTRLACRKVRKKGTKVFYTAHGFHFHKGAPLVNWLLFYPVEWLCAFFTDAIVTINREDFQRAKSNLHTKLVEYIPGVGIDVKMYAEAKVDKVEKRNSIGVPEDAFLLLSVGELNENKNHKVVLEALAKANIPHIHYAIAGKGDLKDELLSLAESLGLKDRFHLLGQRTDVAELYKIADVDVFPSIREGLGLAAVEGMAAGLPLICSDNRGTRDYATSDNAIVCSCSSSDDFANAIITLYNNPEKRKSMSKFASEDAKKFDKSISDATIKRLYNL